MTEPNNRKAAEIKVIKLERTLAFKAAACFPQERTLIGNSTV